MIKEKFQKIIGAILLLVLALVGMWEYMQLYMRFDLPETMVVLPLVGCVAAIFLGKYSFGVPILSAMLSVVYQLIEDQGSQVETMSNSRLSIMLNLLPVVIGFLLLGIAGGMLVRVLTKRKKPLAVGILCTVLGVVLTLGGSVFLFGNPLYPFMAKHAINQYAEKFDTTEYPVNDVISFFSLDELEYEGRVVMSDGVAYALYYNKSTGEVYEVEQ